MTCTIGIREQGHWALGVGRCNVWDINGGWNAGGGSKFWGWGRGGGLHVSDEVATLGPLTTSACTQSSSVWALYPHMPITLLGRRVVGCTVNDWTHAISQISSERSLSCMSVPIANSLCIWASNFSALVASLYSRLNGLSFMSSYTLATSYPVELLIT